MDKFLSTQNVNIARFARNVYETFSVIFQTACVCKKCTYVPYILLVSYILTTMQSSTAESNNSGQGHPSNRNESTFEKCIVKLPIVQDGFDRDSFLSGRFDSCRVHANPQTFLKPTVLTIGSSS